MLSSLPPLAPPDAHTLWYPSTSSHSHPPPPPSTSISARAQQSRPSQTHPPPRTLLSVLRADEAAIALRKANIRRFGAGWLKPPGISKTLQGLSDEKAEREEQEANGLREMEALDAAQARLLEEQAAARGADDAALTGEDGSGDGGGERDLDDEIPDAESGPEWVDEELVGGEGDGDYVEVRSDGEEEMGARDLDEDIPEAGSYQHTDTDVEDETEIEAVGRGEGMVAGLSSSASVLGSSVFGSSPVVRVQRGGRRSWGLGRGQGREN